MYINGNFVCSFFDLFVNGLEIIKNKIIEFLVCIKDMVEDYILMKDKNIDIKKIL